MTDFPPKPPNNQPPNNQPRGVRLFVSASGTAANVIEIASSIISNPGGPWAVNLVPVDGRTPPSPPRQEQLSWFFVFLVTVVFIVAVACLAAQVWLGFEWPHPTDFQQRVAEGLDYGWKMGFGAVVGLFTGRATTPGRASQ